MAIKKKLITIATITATISCLTLNTITSSIASENKPQFAPRPTSQLQEQKQKEKFLERKQMILHLIEKRIQMLVQFKNCVANAQNPEQLKECKKNFHQEHELLKKQWEIEKEKK